MSQLSIYENSWIDLVFEYRNKEYGAYQLRKENTKTTAFAFTKALLFLAVVISIFMITNHFNPRATPIDVPDIKITTIDLSEIKPNQLQKPESPALPEVKTQNTEVPIKSSQLINPVIVDASQASPDIIQNTSNTTNSATDGTATAGSNSSSSSETGTGTAIGNSTDTGTGITVTTGLDKQPEFPGGIGKFYTYVGTNFEKPEIDGVSTIRVYVSFVIEKDGSMTDIQVKNDPGYGLGKEAIRVLKSLKTKWTPGMVASKPVRTAYNLPITIQIE